MPLFCMKDGPGNEILSQPLGPAIPKSTEEELLTKEYIDQLRADYLADIERRLFELHDWVDR